MSAVEKIEKNKIKLTFEATPEHFRKGLTYSYNKNKNSINIPGFRKGKAPRKVIERLYGAEFFYDDAINFVLPDAYENALTANNIEPVYKPSIQLLDAAENKGVIFEAEIYIKPEVTIDGYYGLTYPKADIEPTEADIQEKLQAEREKNARIISVDRPAENGDIVSINFTGYVDDEPFDGGKGDNYELTLGSHSFIDTFEEQLIGHVPGDDVDVNVTFPEDYNHETLAGKPAKFEVEVLDVKVREYPEINDEFAQDVSEYDTLAEYRAYLADKIRTEKTQKAQSSKESHLLRQLVEKADMDVPEVMYTARVDEMVEDLSYRLRSQGMTLEMYLQFSQMTEETLRQYYSVSARESVNSMLALEAVAQKEALTVSDEEYDAHLQVMAEQTGQSVAELKSLIPPARKKEMVNDLLIQKALAFVVEQAIAIEGAIENIVENAMESIMTDAAADTAADIIEGTATDITSNATPDASSDTAPDTISDAPSDTISDTDSKETLIEGSAEEVNA